MPRSKLQWKAKNGTRVTMDGKDAAAVVESASTGEPALPEKTRRRLARRGRR